MSRVFAGIIVAVVLVSGAGAALFVGVGPVADLAGDGGPATADSQAEPSGGDGGGSGSAGSTTPTALPPFTFGVDSIEECGQTCRDVTVTLYNQQDDTATGVTVVTRLYAGQDNTDSGDQIWEGEVAVGSLDAGASYTTTERVELSFGEAFSVQQRDGWITVHTTVRSDERTVTFQESRQVA